MKKNQGSIALKSVGCLHKLLQLHVSCKFYPKLNCIDRDYLSDLCLEDLSNYFSLSINAVMWLHLLKGGREGSLFQVSSLLALEH